MSTKSGLIWQSRQPLKLPVSAWSLYFSGIAIALLRQFNTSPHSGVARLMKCFLASLLNSLDTLIDRTHLTF